MNISIKNNLLKNTLMALIVAVFSFILLTLTFLFDAIYQGALRFIIGLFIPLGPESNLYFFPPLMHLSFVLVIAVISYFVFKSKLKTLYKAIFLSVPTATVLATLGIFLYQIPLLVYSLGAILVLLALYIFYRTKQPWTYYFTLILISLALAIFTLTGGEI